MAYMECTGHAQPETCALTPLQIQEFHAKWYLPVLQKADTWCRCSLPGVGRGGPYSGWIPGGSRRRPIGLWVKSWSHFLPGRLTMSGSRFCGTRWSLPGRFAVPWPAVTGEAECVVKAERPTAVPKGALALETLGRNEKESWFQFQNIYIICMLYIIYIYIYIVYYILYIIYYIYMWFDGSPRCLLDGGPDKPPTTKLGNGTIYSTLNPL